MLWTSREFTYPCPYELTAFLSILGQIPREAYLIFAYPIP